MLKIVDRVLKGFCFNCARDVELQHVTGSVYRGVCEGCEFETEVSITLPLEKAESLRIIIV